MVVFVVVDGGLAAFGAAASLLVLLVIVLVWIRSDRLWLKRLSDWLSAFIFAAFALAIFGVIGVVIVDHVLVVLGGSVVIRFLRNIWRLL